MRGHPQIPQMVAPARQTGDWKPGAVTARPLPDYSRGTKLVVMRWFRRGLSGHLMWLIGREILGKSE